MTSPKRTQPFPLRPRSPASAVAAAIEARFEAWGFMPAVISDVFADPSPGAIAAELDAFCVEHLGASAARLEFCTASVGSVHGLGLTDGRRVVVKALRPETSVARLEAVHAVQRRLHAAGFHCPEPLVPPSPLGRGVGVAESLLRRGRFADAHRPEVRAEMASALAALVSACRGSSELDALRSAPGDDVWLRPHDGRFDFPGTAAGAEWIDEIAARAENVPVAGETVIGHGDWRVENMRFVTGRIAVVYDWDSLVVVREPKLVGSASSHFPSDYGRRDHRQRPAHDESLAFITDYEHARGAAFTPEERRSARATIAGGLAYGARCEHSDRLTDFGRRPAHDPGPWTPPPDSATALLRRHADELLAE